MARFTTEAGIDDLTGKFSKHSRLVMRKKEWHYPDGRVFGCGPKEVYELENRDYKRDPRTPAEQVQYERWKAVCQEASRIAKDPIAKRHRVSRKIRTIRGTRRWWNAMLPNSAANPIRY